MTVVPHPPYSPDLAPRDFFHFPKMEIKLQGRRFDTAEVIQAKSYRVLKMLIQKTSKTASDRSRHVGIVVYAPRGGYFEGDGGD
jgi:hypothetical protein